MYRFWLVKGVRTLITLIFVVTFAFVILRLAGDPVQSMLGPDATVEEMEQFREAWGLNRSLPEQYVSYVYAMVTGDFGYSHADGRPVTAVIAERVPNTLILGVTAYVLALLVGVPAGIVAALNRGKAVDQLIMGVAAFGFALPAYFFGILLILLFSLKLQWLPSSGSGTWTHLIMPALTLGLYHAGALARFTRSSMLDVLGKLYMRAAAAKGAPPSWRIVRHALPNAAIPVVTILGLNLGHLVSGAVVVEVVFAWPGVGRLLVTAVSMRDLSVVQGLVLLVATTMVVANLMVDLLYGLLDPRIRVTG
ncbi:ABC transporter permease [Microvirga brassicacearum]|uniref:ABC transporter permease n=1 Tax=Microvirga brassicacearum TaxID=2580413 RepID=A0A5N3PAS6_9HYPH|nr:ABC transporter permease [Microvirga brassicacearum]KAB0266803.1 ABC transporter permease [Microvirga brassicacearum]